MNTDETQMKKQLLNFIRVSSVFIRGFYRIRFRLFRVSVANPAPWC